MEEIMFDTHCDYKNARKINYNRWSDHKQVDELVSELVAGIESNKKEGYILNMKVLVMDLYHSHLTDPEQYLSYYRDKNHYDFKKRYKAGDIPKAMVNYYLKVARQLMALEQVVIEVFEDNDNLVFKTYYPERIWLESAYWGARSRTELHPKHLTDNELDQVKRMCLLPDRQSRDIEILHKALDL
ncbi:MAG: hypothetical protein WCG87_12080 [Bacteroidota bacterium]